MCSFLHVDDLIRACTGSWKPSRPMNMTCDIRRGDGSRSKLAFAPLPSDGTAAAPALTLGSRASCSAGS